MSITETFAGIAVAFLAMYGLGVPLAWMLPAPETAKWVHRVAIAPVYSIVVATLGAGLLGVLDISLAPWHLVAVTGLAWVLAWHRTGHEWRVRESVRDAVGPAVIMGIAALSWTLSLVGFGLYLPNRDFKNHAYLVAQVAWTRSSEFSFVWRASPISGPSPPEDFYPLGLHVLLGWALPSSAGNTVAVTAASAVLAAAVSGPLSFIVLARMWSPGSDLLWPAAGVLAVFIPSLSGPFGIGSVVLVVGTALFSASLAVLWLWQVRPSIDTTIALALSGLGLFFLHVSEAVGLALIAGALVPGMVTQRRSRVDMRWAAGGVVIVLVVSLAVFGMARRMVGVLLSGFEWDIQPNTESLLSAVVVALVQQPGGSPAVAVLWIALGVVGFWVAGTKRMSHFPLVAFVVPLVLALLATAQSAPAFLQLVTAPWYGSASRVALMAAAPLAVAGCLTLVTVIEQGAGRRARGLASAVALLCIAGLAIQVVPPRRGDLRAALAGAGDTALVADALASRLQPGATVLNLEDDGTANLFAYSRIPVLTGLKFADEVAEDLPQHVNLTQEILNLSDPLVARRLSELNVQYIALGTTSRYWGDGVGYVWQAVADQDEVRLELKGTDMVVLRYSGGVR